MSRVRLQSSGRLGSDNNRGAESHCLQNFVLNTNTIDHRTQHHLGTSDVGAYIIYIARNLYTGIGCELLYSLRWLAANTGKTDLRFLLPYERHNVLIQVESGTDIRVIAHLS